MPKITFISCNGVEYPVHVDAGSSVMEAARDNDVPGIEAECGGGGACATCHVYIDENWVALSGRPESVEQELLEMVADRRKESRLSCQVHVSDDMDGLIVGLPATQGF